MYEQRDYVLEHDDVHAVIKDMIDRAIEQIVAMNTDASKRDENVNYESILKGLSVLGVDVNHIAIQDIEGKSQADTARYCADTIFNFYDQKLEGVRDEFKRIEKSIVLRTMDRNWVEHIDLMDKLRNGIHLRSYAQNNPLQAYIEEGYDMFEEMQLRIAREVVFFAMKVEINKEPK